MITYKEFEFNKDQLSVKELQSVELMKKMLKLCGSIYEKQINQKFPGSNFYPHEVTKEQILEASKENAQILSPYTVVKRDGEFLTVIPYSIEYAEELKQIRDLALEAANLIEEEGLKGYLVRLAKACEDDSWEDLENYWLTIDGNKLDLQLAPIEGYMDGLLNIKHAFQGTLRVYSDSNLFNPDGYIDTVKAINVTTLHNEPVKDYDVIVRVDDIIASGGHSAHDPSLGSNYPNNPEKVKEFGTKILTYANNVVAREEKTLLPILKDVVKPHVLERHTKEEYFAAFVRNLMIHEIAEAFIKYPDEQKRLKDMHLPVQELHSTLMGLKIAAQHVLQGALESKDYEAILLTAFIGKTFYYFYKNEKPESYSRGLEMYIRGYTVAFNYMKEKGAVQIDSNDGLIDIDYAKAFVALDQLANELDEIKSSGTEKEATELFDKYENYSFYEDFRDKVKID